MNRRQRRHTLRRTASVTSILTVTAPPGQETQTVHALRALLDSTRARPGCVAAHLFQEPGRPQGLAYLEMWSSQERFESHVRSNEYDLLLGIMEASVTPPALTFLFVGETRGLEWVEQLRLGTDPTRRG